jgi:N-acyl-D-amino-acid deacylase
MPGKAMDYDLILKHGRVIDGTGGPAYRADVAILNGMIFDVGFLGDSTARKVIDATGFYITPGFIDAHVHGDLMLLADPVHLPALRQGVTTYIIGQDGCSFAPGSKATIDYMRRYTAGFNGNPSNIDYDWDSVETYLARFDRQVAINVAYLIPNGNVRIEVMGHDPRPATDDELKAMQRMVREGMDAGAVGLSTGLDYLPSRHADAREIAALCEVIVPDDGVYVTHMRAYGQNAKVGMDEVYEISRLSGVASHISHFNGPADLLLPLIDNGLAMGHDLTYDTYPYLAGSTILGMVAMPPWVQEGGNEPTLERLTQKPIRDRLKSEWFTTPTQYPLEKMHLAMVSNPEWQWAEGLTVTQAAEQAKLDACDFICDILVASELAVGVVNFRANDRTEEDVRAILRHPSHMAGSDGIFRGGFPHPRGWGAFARYLGYHTRTLGDYTWPEAITHLSTHAARRYRLTDRGLIRPGYVADIAIFDPLIVTDLSTYAAGRTLAEGVKHVVVNGILALENGEPTGATPGRALRRG